MSKDWEWALRLGQKTDFLMEAQSRTGIQFDSKKAKGLWDYCNTEMLRIEKEIEPQLPLRPLNKTELKAWTPPKVQFKNSKEGLIPSVKAEEWFDEILIADSQDGSCTEYTGFIDNTWVILPHYEPIRTEGPMRLKNQADLKIWLQDQGWSPTLWNYKKDQKGKTLRPLRRTTPKFHNQGTLCPDLERMEGKSSIIKGIIRWLSLRNRRSVILNEEKGSGWLSHPRLERDSRLPAGSSGLTYTMRQKHKVVSNIPRVTSILGQEMRSLFCDRKGTVLVGYDAASLEAYVKGHYAYSYEGGEEYFRMITSPGYDEHQTMADKCGTTRQDAKPISYGLQYNQQPKGLAASCGVSLYQAQEWFDSYWEINKPWGLCLRRLERHWETQGKKGIRCPTTGYWLHSRSKHSLGSLLVQHTGAIIMDLSGCLMDKWLGGIKYDSNNLSYYFYKNYEVRRICYYHDEYIWECEEGISQEILQLGIRSVVQSGRILELNVPLAADGAVGNTWGDIH